MELSYISFSCTIPTIASQTVSHFDAIHERERERERSSAKEKPAHTGKRRSETAKP